MSTTSKSLSLRLRYHQNAYQFVFGALRHTQQHLGRNAAESPDADEAHISGVELLDGIRELALQQFGMLAGVVFKRWGVHSTDDFGRIVFELIERGEMRKTDRDQLTDFFDVYDFDEVFDHDYRIDTSRAFRK